MKKTKRVQIFLVIDISLSILLFFAYSHQYALSETDFLSSSLNFKNTDQENLTLTYTNKGNVTEPNDFYRVSLSLTNPFKPIHYFSFERFILDQKNHSSLLRRYTFYSIPNEPSISKSEINRR